jgi:RimJ/RimL family protein N-acetyltransferase
LQEGDLSVEAVRPADIEPIRRWRNAQLKVLRQASPISPRQQIAYYRKHVWPGMRSARPANILLAYLERGSLIGYGGLVHIAWDHRRAEVSFLLKPALARARAQYARCFSGFLRLVRMLAFDDLRLERLHTETYAFRRQHIAVLEAAGFRREGVLRRHVWIDGKPVDALLHACVRTDAR